MKFQEQVDGIKSAFRGFKRINDILAENWTDTNMQAFSNAHIVPITTNGLKCTQEAQNKLTLIDKAIESLEQQITDIDYSIRRSRDLSDSNIDGCMVCHCYVHDQIGDSLMKGFLIPKERVPYAYDKSMLWGLAYDRLPDYKDYTHFMLNELINLR